MNRRKYILSTLGIGTGIGLGYKYSSNLSLAIEYSFNTDNFTTSKDINDSDESKIKFEFNQFDIMPDFYSNELLKSIYIHIKPENETETISDNILSENITIYNTDEKVPIPISSATAPLKITNADIGDEIPINVKFEFEFEGFSKISNNKIITLSINDNTYTDIFYHWKFDEGETDIVTDEEQGQEGNLTDISWENNNWVGNSAVKNSGSGYIDTNSNWDDFGSIISNNDVSFAATVDIPAGVEGRNAIFGSAWDPNTTRWFHFSVGHVEDGLPSVRIRGDDGNAYSTAANYDVRGKGKVRIVCRKLGNSGKDGMKWYINGVEVETIVDQDQGFTGWDTLGNDVYLLAQKHRSEVRYEFNGMVDNLIIFEDGKSENFVKQDYENQPWHDENIITYDMLQFNENTFKYWKLSELDSWNVHEFIDSTVYNGNYALKLGGYDRHSTMVSMPEYNDALDYYPERGVEWTSYYYVNTSSTWRGRLRFHWAIQDDQPMLNNNRNDIKGYSIQIDNRNDVFELRKDGQIKDSANYSTTEFNWFAIIIKWKSEKIIAEIYSSDDTTDEPDVILQIEDKEYDTGGVGFSHQRNSESDGSREPVYVDMYNPKKL